ncbi:MAG: nucleotidyltransferase domain-containing protein [Bacteroidales bacterium]|nr:nucleotidyltransferase domain-containing protein [Bacteroidales bacterium]MDP3002832.1 nucleotidyltransferase domain-containing protein [Bacteroidales bacterium]
MDKKDALIIAQRYASAVKANYNYIRIILFGSYAKGNYTDDSDIDIAVVFKDYSNLMDMQLELMRLRRKIDSRIEPHPFREHEFDLSNPIVNEIIKYGQEIKINVA